MAFYCATMLAMALELANGDPAYEDVASKFFEHFVAITEAMNTLGGTGLWDEVDGFYYDQLNASGQKVPLRIRSMVGIIPLFACEVLEDDVIDRLPGFKKRMLWFLQNRRDLARHISYMEKRETDSGQVHTHHLLAIPSRERLERVLRYVLDENEFLSPYGIRSLSRVHRVPAVRDERAGARSTGCTTARPNRTPACSAATPTGGGRSGSRSITCFVEVLNRYHYYLRRRAEGGVPGRVGEEDEPRGGRGGDQPAAEPRCSCRTRAAAGPATATTARYADDPNWKDLVLFYEYFHGDNGRGVGASHQTGWTALVASLLRELGQPASATAAAGALEAKPAGVGPSDAPPRDGKERRAARSPAGRV